MLVPVVKLDIDNLLAMEDIGQPDVNDEQHSATISSVETRAMIELPPESMCLFPGCIALIDLGDIIVVRKGWKPFLPSLVAAGRISKFIFFNVVSLII
jgi:hypothetical protein